MVRTISARKTFAMLDNETLWTVAERVHAILTERGIAYAIVGGVAVCLHGYRRNTVDLDLLIASDDSTAFREALESDDFIWHPSTKEFRSETGIAVQILITGESAGPKQSVKLPDPSKPKIVESIEGLPVLSLKKLIEIKLACGIGDLRRTHKDFADVLELIAIHELDGSFARFLNPSVRAEFKALVKRVG